MESFNKDKIKEIQNKLEETYRTECINTILKYLYDAIVIRIKTTNLPDSEVKWSVHNSQFQHLERQFVFDKISIMETVLDKLEALFDGCEIYYEDNDTGGLVTISWSESK